MTPDKIDDLISQDIQTNKCALSSLQSSLNFHTKRIELLKGQLGCDHRPEMVDGTHSRCSLCGYRWVR